MDNKTIANPQTCSYTTSMPNVNGTCSSCNKQFLIIEPEQAFLSNKGLPLPAQCPSCRQIRRLSLRGSGRQLFRATCSKCSQEIIVAFDPKTIQNPLYCKKDYDQYILENDCIVTEPLPEV